MCDILLLGDDPLLLATLAEALRDEGFDVREVRSTAEMLDAGNDPLALRMAVFGLAPGSLADSQALTVELRRHSPAIPLAVLTSRPAAVPDFSQDGHDYTMVKPLMPAELCRIARCMIAVGAED